MIIYDNVHLQIPTHLYYITIVENICLVSHVSETLRLLCQYLWQIEKLKHFFSGKAS